jgi:hypothetical protein
MVKTEGKKEIAIGVLFSPQSSPPTAEKGKVYFDNSDNKMKVSEDGSTYKNL